MELKGSRTEANLMAAFAGESQARNKYTYYASAAKKEGYEQIANIFSIFDIKTEIIASGDLDRVSVSPRKVVECALAAKAAAVILVHNHPSGDPTPSMEDILLTKEIVRSAALLGIAVHDHIIVGKGTHYSLKANGKIA